MQTVMTRTMNDDNDDLELYGHLYEREPKERDRLVECTSDDPNKRKRWQVKGDPWVPVTVGYLTAWFGILLLMCAQGVRCWSMLWAEEYGFNLPFIQNTMPKNRFEQIRRFIHFVDNKKLPKKGGRNWNPLQKIFPFMEKMLLRFQLGYILGQFLTVDESMIKYKGKQIRFIQYMPAKPIKHGIKVFALCCAETGYLYGCWIYCGKDNDSCTNVEIIERLMAMDGELLNNSSGRVLYTDNYYTSESLMEMMHTKYNAFVVGTTAMTKKKSRTKDDFPFHKLSGPMKKRTPRGWLRWAQKKVLDAAGNLLYVIQGTTWMDRKQVAVLHNWKVGPPGDTATLRYSRDTRRKEAVSTHPIIPDYIQYMRGVDRFDQSMNDYNISQRSNRWYLRIFYYFINATLANMRTVTKGIVKQSKSNRELMRREGGLEGTGKADPWEMYTTKTMGWCTWLVHLGFGLIWRGIEMDWTDVSDNSKRPKWLRQKPFKPCLCKRCFFCKKGLTNMYGEQPISNKRSRISGMPASSMSTLTPTSSFSSTPKSSRTSASSSSSSAASINDAEAHLHESVREAMFGSSAMSSNESSTPKSLPGTLLQRTEIVRGKVVVVHHDHLRSGEKPWRLFERARDCGVCQNQGRMRWKSTPDCPSKWEGEVSGLQAGGQEFKLFLNRCTTGCPHVNCRDRPVCKEHWPTFVHVGLEAAEADDPILCQPVDDGSSPA